MIHYTCPRCGQTGKAANELAGGMLACRCCNQTIELPSRPKVKADATDPNIDLGKALEEGANKTVTVACQHCGQTLLTTKELLSEQVCSRCGKARKAAKAHSAQVKADPPAADGMIRFHCDGCEQRLKAPFNAAGKKATCGRCGRRVRIPRPPSSADGNPFIFTA